MPTDRGMWDPEPQVNGGRRSLRRGARLFAAAVLFVFLASSAAALFVLFAGRADGGTPRIVLTLTGPERAGSPLDEAVEERPPGSTLDGLEDSAPDDATRAPPSIESGPLEDVAGLPGDSSDAAEGGDEALPAAGDAETPADELALSMPPGSLPEAGDEVTAPVDSLSPAPDPALVAYGRHGPLPVIAPDGRRALNVYARPFNRKDKRPRLAIIVGGLGLSRATTEAAIAMLPPAVTLSFTPYAKDLQNYLNAARAAGHEVVLELPMEPFDYPHNDPGPFTLLTQTALEENEDKLEWLMSRFTGYAGVVNDQGEKLLSTAKDLKPVLKIMSDRGLYFLDRGTTQNSVVSDIARAVGLPFATAVGPIDTETSREDIERRLENLERVARENGSAIGTGFNYPVTIERVRDWAETLERRGYVLAPVSALLKNPKASGAS